MSSQEMGESKDKQSEVGEPGDKGATAYLSLAPTPPQSFCRKLVSWRRHKHGEHSFATLEPMHHQITEGPPPSLLGPNIN